MLKIKSIRDSITQHSGNVLPKTVECSSGNLGLKYFKALLNVQVGYIMYVHEYKK